MVLPCQGFLDELDAVLLGLFAASVSRCHDRDAIRCNADMPQEEGQHALPNTAKTDDQNPSREIDVDLVIAHDAPMPSLKSQTAPRHSLHLVKFIAASAADKCDRSREVPPRARPIDRARDN